MSDDLLRIRRIKDALSRLGPILPGSISTQWNVCGKPGCGAKTPKNRKSTAPITSSASPLTVKSSSLFVKRKT